MEGNPNFCLDSYVKYFNQKMVENQLDVGKAVNKNIEYRYTNYMESEYYENYLIFLKDYNHLNFSEIILYYPLFNISYYDYYVKFSPVTFALKKSLDYNFSIGSRGGGFTIDKRVYNYLYFFIYDEFITSLEIDSKSRPCFYKKRLINKILPVVDSIYPEVLFFMVNSKTKYITEDIKREKFNEKVEKTILLFEEILLCLQFCVPLKDYAAKENLRTITSQEEKRELLTSISSKEDYDRYIKREEGREEGDETLRTASFLELVENVITINNYEAMFLMSPKRIVIFSEQFNIVPKIEFKINSKAGIIRGSNVYFKDTNSAYPLIVYNKSNTREHSQLKIDMTVLSYLIASPVIFNKSLFFEIENLFIFKYKYKNYTYDKKKLSTITNKLKEMFIQNNGDYLKIYYPWFQDFRGRLYMATELSLTQVKLLRFIVSPEKNKVDIGKIRRAALYNKLKKFLTIINKLSWIKKYNLLEEEQMVVLLGLINLGKIKKSKLLEAKNKYLEVDQKVCYLNIEEIIREGIHLYEKDDTKIWTKFSEDSEDLGYILTLKKKITNFLEKRESFSVIVDSTASGFLHLSLWLKLKKEYVKYTNLTEELIWYDTYVFLYIESKKLFKKKYEEEIIEKFEKDIEVYFTRKRMKKVFMTIPYNATLFSQWNYFKEGLTVDEIKLIKPYFNKFTQCIYELFETLFETPWSKFKEIPKLKDLTRVKLLGNEYDYTYYYWREVSRSLKINGYRSYWVEQIFERDPISQELIVDKDKMETSLAANVIHTTDSLFLTLTYIKSHSKGISLQTIHDEFIVPVDGSLMFLEIMNESIEEVYGAIHNEKNIVVPLSFFIVI